MYYRLKIDEVSNFDDLALQLAFIKGEIAEKGNVNVNIFQLAERTFYFAKKGLQTIIYLKKDYNLEFKILTHICCVWRRRVL